MHQASGLVERRVLPRKLHVKDGMRIVQLESEEAARLHQRLLRRVKLAYERVQARQSLISQNVQVVALGLV